MTIICYILAMVNAMKEFLDVLLYAVGEEKKEVLDNLFDNAEFFRLIEKMNILYEDIELYIKDPERIVMCDIDSYFISSSKTEENPKQDDAIDSEYINSIIVGINRVCDKITELEEKTREGVNGLINVLSEASQERADFANGIRRSSFVRK